MHYAENSINVCEENIVEDMPMIDKIRNHSKALSLCIAVFLAGCYYAYSFVKENPNIPDSAHNIVHPPTSKEEDLYEIGQELAELKNKMETMMHLLNKMQDKVEAKRMDSIKPYKVGINNYELSQWEISVSGKNTMHLEEGNAVLIINARSPHKQSGHFTVKFVRKNEEYDKPELYINLDAASFLGIENPELFGTFELNVEKIKQ